MILWVIGAGGLFGSAVVRAAKSKDWIVFDGASIPWHDPDSAVALIRADAKRLANSIKNRQSWGIVWAAGRATTASTEAEVASELFVFKRALAAIAEVLEGYVNGTFLLASSAGGVYAGSRNPPFNSETIPNPIGTYGNLKRDQEIEAETVLPPSMKVVIARISNLYGPGQDLQKLQGLVSRLALTAITKQTLTMFVPLETLRDYIDADDAADIALHWLEAESQRFAVRVIASGNPTTLGHIIRLARGISRTQVPIAAGLHPSASVQARDIRLEPDQDSWTSRASLTPLAVGTRRVFEDVLRRFQQGLHPHE